MNTTFTSWLFLKTLALSDGIYMLFQHVSKQDYMQTETGIAPDQIDQNPRSNDHITSMQHKPQGNR